MWEIMRLMVEEAKKAWNGYAARKAGTEDYARKLEEEVEKMAEVEKMVREWREGLEHELVEYKERWGE